MKFRVACAAAVLGVCSVFAATSAAADTIVADTVIDFFNSGANPSFPTGPYGGTFPAPFPVVVPTSFATDGNPNTFVSLPTGSYITLGFTGGFVFDGVGDDLFVSEIGAAAEMASVLVSSDGGTTFTFLGTAAGNTVSTFDLADIGYTGNVNAVRIIGLDNNGGSPGFDVSFVEGLEGSVAMVPEPGTLALLGLGALGMTVRRRRRSTLRAA